MHGQGALHGLHNEQAVSGRVAVDPYGQGPARRSRPHLYSGVSLRGAGAVHRLSHEINETITDPLQGANRDWIDSGGNEIGDECAGNYGPQLGTFDQGIGYGPQPYNTVINGHDYYTQTEFSNSAYAALGVGNGCVQTPFGAVPMTGARTRTHNVTSVSSDVSLDASPAAVPADGTSTSTVTITDLDADGEPVAGDQMFLSTRLDVASTLTQGTCGNLGNPRGQTATTDANGQFAVTYTATTDNAECYVEATDLSQGTTNEVLIYQGTDNADAPTVTQTTPASLTAGGPAVTFTATGTNPADDNALADARFDLHLTGDSSGSTGIDASDLMLSYKDGATNGQFVNVPLSGSTADGGTIDGFVIPDMAQALPADASRTATFQLALAAGAPNTATTGSPLTIETDLDNYNPADGSAGNLDYTTGDVPVAANPGDSITYSGKLSTTKAPTATASGSATLVANTCKFASDASKCLHRETHHGRQGRYRRRHPHPDARLLELDAASGAAGGRCWRAGLTGPPAALPRLSPRCRSRRWRGRYGRRWSHW